MIIGLETVILWKRDEKRGNEYNFFGPKICSLMVNAAEIGRVNDLFEKEKLWPTQIHIQQVRCYYFDDQGPAYQAQGFFRS